MSHYQPVNHYCNDVDYAHDTTHIFTAVRGGKQSQYVFDCEDHHASSIQTKKYKLYIEVTANLKTHFALHKLS